MEESVEYCTKCKRFVSGKCLVIGCHPEKVEESRRKTMREQSPHFVNLLSA